MTRLQPKPVIRFIRNPFGRYAKSLKYRDGEVSVFARRPQYIDLHDITSAPVITRGFGGRDLTIRCRDGSSTLLKGASPQKASAFAKVIEEDWIANWLYSNGIDYEYEPNYEHKVSEDGYRDYCPDFRLKKSGIYIEHFGVRRRTGNSGTTELTTAPFVDRDEYLRGMTWKRGVHAEHGTTLIETFSYERQEGRLLEALAEKFRLTNRSPHARQRHCSTKWPSLARWTASFSWLARSWGTTSAADTVCPPARRKRTSSSLEVVPRPFCQSSSRCIANTSHGWRARAGLILRI